MSFAKWWGGGDDSSDLRAACERAYNAGQEHAAQVFDPIKLENDQYRKLKRITDASFLEFGFGRDRQTFHSSDDLATYLCTTPWPSGGGPLSLPKESGEARRIAGWLSAALEDPNVCDEMKMDIKMWFDVGSPVLNGMIYGIIDPDYGRVYTIVRKLAWEEGYAIGLHGSFTRDLDLIAVPWTEKPCEPEHLVRRVIDATGLRSLPSNPGTKPQGRLVWTLLFKEFNDPRFVDFSVIHPTSYVISNV